MPDSLDTMPRVSIVVPAYNAEATLERCLHACLHQTYPNTEVILVDDGSIDATPRIAAAFPIHYVQQQNRGPAAARNRGAAEGEGDFVAFTDADCVPAPDWIEQLLAGFEEGIVAVGGTYGIANSENTLARMIHKEILDRHAIFQGQSPRTSHLALHEVDFLGSFNVMYRREAFQSVGGFDESFPHASAEDNDLSYRLIDAGGILRFNPRAIVNHYHPARLIPYLRAQTRHGYWRVKLYVKHPNRTTKGDRYAGLAELLAPAMALLAVAVALCAEAGRLFGRRSPLPPAIEIPIMLAYVLFCVWRAVRLTFRTRQPRMLLFLPVIILRDLARGLGMLGGLVRFILVAKGAH